MKQLVYLILCIAFFSGFGESDTSIAPIAATQNNHAGYHPAKSHADSLWIQKVLDNWTYVCLNELNIEMKALPWIIFYDSSSAWHLNADETMLPALEKTQYSVVFAGVNYRLVKLPHTDSIWVPGRAAFPLTSPITTTAPYAQNSKVFFIAPLPSFFHKLAPPDQASYLDFLILGAGIHELTHTRQLPSVLPQLLDIHRADNNKTLDDNTVENKFSKNDQYRQLFFAESTHLWKAVFTADGDSCLKEIAQAFKLMEIRKQEFFTGDNKGLGQADEIFLSLEGSAMWAQYRIMLKNAPAPDERELLSWLVKQMPAWSQERGLVLFLLIDRFDPAWKDRFFGKQLPPASEYLRNVVALHKK